MPPSIEVAESCFDLLYAEMIKCVNFSDDLPTTFSASLLKRPPLPSHARAAPSAG